MRVLALALLALALAVPAAEAHHRCWHKQDTCEPPPPSSGTVLLDEQFNGAAGTAPNPAVWHRYDYCDRWTAAGRAIQSCNLPGNAVLDGQGRLAITARYAPGHVDRYGTTGFNYTSGRVESGKRWENTALFGFRYGEASAWIRFPGAQGSWSGFWMQTLKNQAGRWGEIDVVEYLGRETNSVWHANVHMWPGNVASGGRTCDAGVDLTAEFHKYTARWAPGRVDVLLDDRLCYTALRSAFTAWYLDDMPAILLLSLDVDGWGGAPNPADYPASMLVDRVLVTG